MLRIIGYSLLLVICSLGCAESRYLANRGKDLADIGKVSVGIPVYFHGWGVGPGIDVQATDFIHPSLGYRSFFLCFGHENRDISLLWADLSWYYPFSLEENRTGVTLHRNFDSIFDNTVSETSYYMTRKEYYRENIYEHVKVSWVKRMGFEATVSALLVNARVGINPAEVLDFVLGFAGIDIAGDDEKEVASVETKPQIEGQDNSK